MSKKVDAMMVQKVDIANLYKKAHPNMYEKLVLELARELERKRDPDFSCTSWASQQEAAAYFNEHGFEATLEYRLDLAKVGA